MGLLTFTTTALALLLASPLYARINSQNINTYPFPDDLINATTTVSFNGYNVTDTFSNSSEANTPWQARIKIRSNIHPEEISDDFDPDHEDFEEQYIAMAQISLTYDIEDSGDVDEPDESWGYCVATQPLFNITLAADDNVNSNCEGVIAEDCIAWLQDYVDRGGPCTSNEGGWPDDRIWIDIVNDSPCPNGTFPEPSDTIRRDEEYITSWGFANNLTLSEMNLQYDSMSYEDKDDTEDYDELARQVYVLLASWGGRRMSRRGGSMRGSI